MCKIKSVVNYLLPAIENSNLNQLTNTGTLLIMYIFNVLTGRFPVLIKNLYN